MHDIGGLIWVVVVLIGVISSLSRSARRARAQQRAAAAPSTVPQAFAASAGLEMPPVIAPTVVPRPVPAPRSAPVPPQVPVAAAQVLPLEPVPTIGTSPIRGMFQGPATLVRAIVAAEVLGPPKSMQEQTIWSPRHSEPSI